jgi:hypothetical protein
MNKNMTTTLLVAGVLGVVLAFVAAAGAIVFLPGDDPLAADAYSLVVDSGRDPASNAMSLPETQPVDAADAVALAVAPSSDANREGDVPASDESPAVVVPSNATATAAVAEASATPDAILVATGEALIAKVTQDGLSQLPTARAVLATLMPNN